MLEMTYIFYINKLKHEFLKFSLLKDKARHPFYLQMFHMHLSYFHLNLKIDTLITLYL